MLTGEPGSLVSLSFWNGAVPNFNPKSILSFTIIFFFLIQAPPGGALIVFFILLPKCSGRIEPLLHGSSTAEDGADLAVRYLLGFGLHPLFVFLRSCRLSLPS